MMTVIRSLALLPLLVAVPCLAQPKKKKDAPAGPEAAAMAQMMKLATPGAPHKVLKKMVGSFEVKGTFWMAPGKPPVKSEGTAEFKMVLGDRFLMQEYSGNMMNRPFSGIGYTGFDNQKKKYVATWIDSMGTMMLVLEGTGDKAGKVITMNSEFVDPATGKSKKARAVHKLVSAKKHVYEWFESEEGGKERKTMEIVYTKK